MATVYILGAGASIGSGGETRTRFPRTEELLRCVRTEVQDVVERPLPALTVFLNRYLPLTGCTPRDGRLHDEWDSVNVEELFSAIEFEARITSHLLHGKWWDEYFDQGYQKDVRAVVSACDGKPRHFVGEAPVYGWDQAQSSEGLFPYIHKSFLKIVRYELLDSISQGFDMISAASPTESLGRLAQMFELC